jgi:hypothetical protein
MSFEREIGKGRSERGICEGIRLKARDKEEIYLRQKREQWC